MAHSPKDGGRSRNPATMRSLYDFLFHELGDQRFKSNILTDTPWAVIALLFVYWRFARVWGPKFMENRQPYKIEGLMTIYNIVQIVWNLYMFSLFRCGLPVLSHNLIKWWCIPVDMTCSTRGVLFRYGITIYFYNKIFDLLDTVFMVLRKKNKQISTLHLNHHSIMVAGLWWAVKYHPGGNGVAIGILNSLVHVFMYSYYQLSLMGAEWVAQWKPNLTMIQMAQFGLVNIMMGAIFVDNHCKNGLVTTVLGILLATYFVYIFSVFYFKTYLKPERDRWKLNERGAKEYADILEMRKEQ